MKAQFYLEYTTVPMLNRLKHMYVFDDIMAIVKAVIFTCVTNLIR